MSESYVNCTVRVGLFKAFTSVERVTYFHHPENESGVDTSIGLVGKTMPPLWSNVRLIIPSVTDPKRRAA